MFTRLLVGSFIALRQVQRSNIWVNILIVFVMMVTFLNLIVVNGILIGLVQGSEEAFHKTFSGDVMISDLKRRPHIDNTTEIISFINRSPLVKDFIVRYIQLGTIEEYEQDRKPGDLQIMSGGSFEGIDPGKVDRVFGLSTMLVEGEYLKSDDQDSIMLGANLLEKYMPISSPSFRPLRTVVPGSKVRVHIGSVSAEMKVVGIIRTKNSELDQHIYINAERLRQMTGRNEYEANQIAVVLKDGVAPEKFRDMLIAQGFERYADIRVWQDTFPQFLDQIKKTFAVLGGIIGSVGIMVSAITIFIVIFVNVVTRRKFIGILKGIGISPEVIETAYVIQSVFYAMCGSVLALIVVFGILKPYINAHPINFPFSDGILVATFWGTSIRVVVVFIATILAGYIPARLIVRKNTLDSILGR